MTRKHKIALMLAGNDLDGDLRAAIFHRGIASRASCPIIRSNARRLMRDAAKRHVRRKQDREIDELNKTLTAGDPINDGGSFTQ